MHVREPRPDAQTAAKGVHSTHAAGLHAPQSHLSCACGCNEGCCFSQELDSAHGTVYTIRLTTSYDRGSALSEPNTAVNVCLISKDGASLIHRVAAVNDPDQSRNELEDICNVSYATSWPAHPAMASHARAMCYQTAPVAAELLPGVRAVLALSTASTCIKLATPRAAVEQHVHHMSTSHSLCIASHSAPADGLLLPAPPAQLVDDSVGANCQLATTTDTPWRPAAASPKHRFQEGSVDEVRLQHSTAVS